MKLRYYMRGLGIGIIVTALTMGVAAGEGLPLTDAEIRAAALKLGMVESDSLRLTDIQPAPAAEGNAPSGEAGAPQESEDSGEAGEAQDGEDGGEAGEAQDGENGGEAGDFSPEQETQESIPEPEETPESAIPEPEETAPEEGSGTVTITVMSGSGSRTVCNQLEEAGLIEDAGSFDQYLIDNGYSKRICVGTYEIAAGSDWEEIAKIISRTR